jgi:hypothetical protein
MENIEKERYVIFVQIILACKNPKRQISFLMPTKLKKTFLEFGFKKPI